MEKVKLTIEQAEVIIASLVAQIKKLETDNIILRMNNEVLKAEKEQGYDEI